jgi:hypothetical protein
MVAVGACSNVAATEVRGILRDQCSIGRVLRSIEKCAGLPIDPSLVIRQRVDFVKQIESRNALEFQRLCGLVKVWNYIDPRPVTHRGRAGSLVAIGATRSPTPTIPKQRLRGLCMAVEYRIIR